MAGGKRLICAGADLPEAGRGVRFQVTHRGREAEAFAIRFAGQVRGFVNECGHLPAQLDWVPGEFFDGSKLYLICSVHGALYDPQSGQCLGGRCRGKGLPVLALSEIDGQIYLNQEDSHG